MATIEPTDPQLDAKDPHTRLFLLAEHWKREAQHFAAMSSLQEQELLRTWFVLKEFGHHPGRTEDRLSDCVRKALTPNVRGKQP